MPGEIDDKRAASSITASLSSYLITVALGVIAAEVLIVTFVFDADSDEGNQCSELIVISIPGSA